MNAISARKLIASSLTLFAFLFTACNQAPDAVPSTAVGLKPIISGGDPLKPQDFGTTAGDYGNDIAVNTTGVYVVGDTDGSLDGVNKGGRDAFIRKYDGGVVWAQQFGTRNEDGAKKVAVDSSGNSYVVGITSGALGFKVGNQDAFLRKYNASGVVQWTRQFGTPSFDSGVDVALDSGGNIFVLSQEAASGFTVRKFNSSGVALTSRTVTNPGLPGLYPTDMAVDSAGNVLVLARWIPTVIQIRVFKLTNTLTDVWNVAFQPSTTDSYGYDITTFGTDIYVTAKLDASTVVYGARTLTAVKQLEPTTTCNCTEPTSITVDGNGDIYVTGYTFGSFPGFTNAGFSDIVVLKYNSAHTRLWAKQFGQGNYGSVQDDYAFGIAVSDAVYITGYTYGNLLGDPKYGTNDSDAFLAQIDKTTGTVLGVDQ
jgi:Beta-propeller repeat